MINMDSDNLHKLTKTELVHIIANYDSLIIQIKTQLYEALRRKEDYEDTIKMLIAFELENFKPKGEEYDRLIRFKPTTHRAKSF